MKREGGGENERTEYDEHSAYEKVHAIHFDSEVLFEFGEIRRSKIRDGTHFLLENLFALRGFVCVSASVSLM